MLAMCVLVVAQPASAEETDSSRFLLGVLVGPPSLRLTDSEKLSIFRIHTEASLENMHLEDDAKVREREQEC